jgi:hypothetical protein
LPQGALQILNRSIGNSDPFFGIKLLTLGLLILAPELIKRVSFLLHQQSSLFHTLLPLRQRLCQACKAAFFFGNLPRSEPEMLFLLFLLAAASGLRQKRFTAALLLRQTLHIRLRGKIPYRFPGHEPFVAAR